MILFFVLSEQHEYYHHSREKDKISKGPSFLDWEWE